MYIHTKPAVFHITDKTSVIGGSGIPYAA
jgi:hypothetical protein